ncbi:hypothetical protein ACIQ9E_20440 [Streptomyces sp. NPDC094448]|uniref:hypothetical protein n=1 Tax=Streptomyces sp. NPDC094448 TaxID=3366063 RepID=UPI0037F35E6A
MKPHRKSRSSAVPDPGPERDRMVRGGAAAAVAALLPLAVVAGGDGFRAALDFTTGVLSLLSLTAAVAWGLIATDRRLLSPRHRLVAQAVHRATAAAALGFLVLHASVKLTLGHVGAVAALIPFGRGFTGTEGLIGFGALAGVLMAVAGATGALRSSLAGRVRIAGRWRALHMLAYPAWCAALVHGLFAGRPAAGWVVGMYCLALLAVGGAVSLRLLPRPVQRKPAVRIARPASDGRAAAGTSGDPSGRPVPEGVPGSVPEGGTEAVSGGPARSGSAPFLPGPVPSGAVTGQDRPWTPMLTPPSPRLYEAPPLYGVPRRPDPAAHTARGFGDPDSDPAYAPPDTGHTVTTPGAGTGFAAAYHAVSRPGGPGRPAPPRTATGYRTGTGTGNRTKNQSGTGVRPGEGAGTGPMNDSGRTVPNLFPPRSGEPWSTPAGDRT